MNNTMDATNIRFLRIAEQTFGWNPTVFEEDPETGRMHIIIKGPDPEQQQKQQTEEDDVRAAQITTLFQSTAGETILQNLTERIRSIQDISDPYHLLSTVQDIESAIRKTQIDFTKHAQERLAAELNLPSLEAEVRQGEFLDRQHPDFLIHGTDSNETLLSKKKLETAQKLYNSKVKEAVALNPLLAELTATANSLESMAKLQMSAIEKKLNASERAAWETAKQVQQMKLELGDLVKYVPILFPGYASDAQSVATFAETWAQIPHRNKEALIETMSIADTQPQALIPLALSGNDTAKKLLLHQEKQTGRSETETLGKLSILKDITESADAARRAVKVLMEVGLLDTMSKEERTAFENQRRQYTDPVLSTKLTAGQQKEAQLWRYSIAQKYLAHKTLHDIINNVSNLHSSAARPAWLDIVEKDPKWSQGKPVSVDTVVEYINALPNLAAQHRAAKEFLDYYHGALKNHAKSHIGTIAPALELERVKAALAKKHIRVIEPAPSGMSPYYPYNPHR